MRLALALVTSCLYGGVLSSAAAENTMPPEIKGSTLRIVHVGQTETFTLYGENLASATVTVSKAPLRVKLLSVRPTEGEAKVRGSQQASVEVTVPPSTVPDSYDLVLKNPDGTKLNVPIAVIAAPGLAETVKKPCANFTQAMPLTSASEEVTGAITRETYDVFAFSARAGEMCDITLLAGRVGSELDAVVRLRDAHHLSLALSAGIPQRDRHIRFCAPVDGTYYVEVTDADGRGGPTFTYHLIVKHAEPHPQGS